MQTNEIMKVRRESRRSRIMLAKTFEIGDIVLASGKPSKVVAFIPKGTSLKDAWVEYLKVSPNALPSRSLSITSGGELLTHRYFVERDEKNVARIFCPLLDNMKRITK